MIMKILPRTQFGNPILRAKARKVSLNFLKTAKGKALIKNMIHTMRRSGGVGLAAPQIGESLRIAVMEIRTTPDRPKTKHQGPIVVVNPVIKEYSKDTVLGWEGCLSIMSIRGQVSRSNSVTVEYHNEDGKKVIEKASGLWARIFQHEIDHLNGVGYFDRIRDTKTIMTRSEFKKRVMKKK
jgi:peptide deformylase